MPDTKQYSFAKALSWVAFVALMFWLNYSARSTLSPMLISVELDLNIGHTSSTSLLLMQSIGFSTAFFLSGFCLCRMRPRHMSGMSILLSGMVLAAMPWADSMLKVRIVFLLFGFFAGFYFPAGMATLTSLVENKDIGKAIAVHELAPSLGFILIPLIAQGLLLMTTWRKVYAIFGGLMIVTGIMFMLLAKGGRSYSPPPSFRGISVMLKNPATAAVFILMTIATIGEFSVFSILQIFLVNSANFQPEAANLAISTSRLATPLGVVIGGLAADRLNPYICMGACLLLHAAAMILMCRQITF